MPTGWTPTEIGAALTAATAAIGGLWATFGKPRVDSQAALRERIEGMLKEQREELERRMTALETERDELERRLETVERELADMRYDLRTWQDYGRDIISGRFPDIGAAQARAHELLNRSSPPSAPPST